MAESGPNIAPFLDLAVQIIQASGGDTKRADEAAHILASSTVVNTYPAVEGLVKALETAIMVADEARVEWDRAPSGMKAGKLLIALSDPELKYRADITEMHAALSSFRSLQNGGEN